MSSLAASPVVDMKQILQASPLRRPSSPATASMPLGSLSPERVQNTPRFGQASVPQSPSLPALPASPSKHARQLSDVQGMVARFNSLDIKDHAELRKRDKAALDRAQMGREEAETELKKTREHIRALKKDQDESKERERKVMRRVDVLMEDLHRSKETHQHAQSLYEKEIRRARKEAFKSSSALVKMQEELKATRAQLKVAHANLASEKLRSESKDQDTFTAQYELVGAQETLTLALARIKIVEEERDALKTTLREEEVARVASQGQIALPPSQDGDDEFGTPIKAPRPQQVPDDLSRMCRDLEHARSQLDLETRQRVLAQEQVDFMKMECQFGCCSCRVAESHGSTYVFDNKAAAGLIAVNPQPPRPTAMDIDHDDTEHTLQLDLSQIHDATHSRALPVAPSTLALSREHSSMALLNPRMPARSASTRPRSPVPTPEPFSVSKRVEHFPQTPVQPRSAASSGRATPAARRPSPADEPVEREESEDEYQDDRSQPETPGVAVRTVTHTTTIPLVDESTPGYSAFFVPGSTLTREEALERIRERRGRARSVTGTPKRSASAAAAARTPRRDISAPEHGKTPKSSGNAPVSTRR